MLFSGHSDPQAPPSAVPDGQRRRSPASPKQRAWRDTFGKEWGAVAREHSQAIKAREGR